MSLLRLLAESGAADGSRTLDVAIVCAVLIAAIAVLMFIDGAGR